MPTAKRLESRHESHKAIGAILVLAGAVGSVASLPLIFSIQRDVLRALGANPVAVAVATVVQTTVLVTLAVVAGLTLGRRVGLGLVRVAAPGTTWTTHVPGAMLTGAAVGAAIVALDVLLPTWRPTQAPTYPLWQGLLASLYGGVTEELLLRFGLFSTLAYLGWRLTPRRREKPSNTLLWIVNAIVAIAFGLLHLPATAALGDLTPLTVARALLLNGIGGLAFGYLYWRRGLETAIVAHFTADFVIQSAISILPIQ